MKRHTHMIMTPTFLRNKKTKLSKIVTGLMAGIALFTLSTPVTAQERVGEAIAAIVNDKMISTFDMRQRIQLMVLTSGGQIPESAMVQLQARVLTDLIEEQLKLQEAERLEFNVDEAEIDGEVARIAAQGQVSIQQLAAELARQGVTLDALREQIRANVVWQRLVSARYGSRVNVTDDEIETMMSKLLEDSRKVQYNLSEICLPIKDPSQTQTMFQAGMQVIGQLRQGVPFNAMARQFSSCSSAANGGDLGWLASAQLPDELAEVVKNLQPGSVSTPLPYDGNMYILALRQKRDAAKAGEQAFTVAYASLPVSKGEEIAREAFGKLKKTNMCNAETLSVDLGPDVAFEALPPLPESIIQPEFIDTLKSMERGDISNPIDHAGYYHGFLMCEKDTGYGLPNRAQIEGQLRSEELELLSRRYLRDLERDSSVEVLLEQTPAQKAPNGNG